MNKIASYTSANVFPIKVVRHKAGKFVAPTRESFRIMGISWLQKYIDIDDEVIDFGCGLMPITRKLKCKKLIGIEVYEPNIEKLRIELACLSNVYIWQFDLAGPFLGKMRNNSTDIALAIDVVEHFPPKDSKRLINEMERIGRKRIVIFTPIGYVPQEREENRKHQRHRCGYFPEELEALGYTTFLREGGNVPSFLAVKELN